MAPGHSKRDAQMLYNQLASGQIFAAFSPQDRDAIWSRFEITSTFWADTARRPTVLTSSIAAWLKAKYCCYRRRSVGSI